MYSSICLLSFALTLGQPTDRAAWQLTPQLAPGLELVYTGDYLDETLIPNAQHQRRYRLETYLFVIDAGVKDWHVAFMTALSLQDVKQSLDKKAIGPTSVRLDQAKIDWQGRVRTFDKKLLDNPIQGPATLEIGFFVPAPWTKVGRNYSWEINDPGLPRQHWEVIGPESCGGVTCVKVTGLMQSEDWDHGRADKAAWRRRDTLWLHPQLMVAQRVERIIEERAAARDTPTHRSVVRYELESNVRYPGRLFEDRKAEIFKASKFHEDAQLLLRQPVLNRTLTDSLIQRVSFHLNNPQAQQETPYRKAILHVKTVLEKAKQGDVPAPQATEDYSTFLVKGLDVGQRVPDFAVSSLTNENATQLKSLHGTPVLVFFYNPATQLGRDVLGYARTLWEKQPGKIAVLAMAVTQDADLVKNQHKDLRLPFPIHDGNGMRATFGAVETPRFVLLDGDGVVRLAQTGWGLHTPHDIAEMLQRCQKK